MKNLESVKPNGWVSLQELYLRGIVLEMTGFHGKYSKAGTLIWSLTGRNPVRTSSGLIICLVSKDMLGLYVDQFSTIAEPRKDLEVLANAVTRCKF